MRLEDDAHSTDHSFHPHVSDASVIIAMSKRSSNVNMSKNEELYNDRERFNKNNKTDLRDDDKALMLNGEEYTF